MADLAQFGIRIPPVEGKEQAKESFKEIGDAGEQAGKRIAEGMKVAGAAAKTAGKDAEAGGGGFASLTNSITRNAGGFSMLLRSIAPLGGESLVMASQLERGALAVERIGALAADTTTKSELLNAAFEKGAIGAATMGAAQEKLSADRTAAALAETAYAEAVARSTVAQAEAATLAATIREQRVIVGDLKGSDRQIQEQRVLNELRRESLSVSAGVKAAAAEESAAKDRLASANRTLAESQALVNDAEKASTIGFGGTIALVGGLIAALVALGVALELVKKGWDFLKDSVKAAAHEQQQAMIFTNTIGAGGGPAFEQLRAFYAEKGIFKLDDLVEAATKIKLLGAATQNVVPYTKDLAAGAALIGTTVTAMGTAFEQIMMGRVMRPTRESSILLRQMAQDLNLPQEGMQRWARDATPEVRIKALVEAVKNLGREGGVAFNAVANAQGTYEGKLDKIGTSWEQIKVKFGEPIIDKLGPILDDWNGKLGQGQGLAVRWGTAIADAIQWAYDKFKGSGEQASKETGQKMAEGIKAAGWAEAGDEAGTTFAESWVGKLYARLNAVSWSDIGRFISSGGTETLGANTTPATPEPKTPPLPPSETMNPDNVDTYRTAVDGATNANDHFFEGLQKGKKAVDDFTGDLQIYNDYWYQYSRIQAGATSSTEATNRILELQDKTLKELRDPARFTDIGNEWQRMEAAKVLAEKQADEAIKNGSATTLQSIQRGIQKLGDEWGNWDTAVEKMTVDIGNALGNNIAAGLSSILDGTKSVGQGFRDMALAVVKAIEEIIIKMLVLQALKAALNFFSPGAGAAVPVAHAGGTIGVSAFPTRTVDPFMFAAAPRFHGGLAPDEFPAILQRGEQVIPAGGGRGGGTQIFITQTITSDGGKTSSNVKGDNAQDAKDLARMIEGAMDQYARKNRRHGGTLR